MKRCALFLMAVSALAQSGKSLAPWDLTGYWVSIVTEDWRYRMQTAPKYDYYGFVLKAEAKKVADAWDAEKGPQGEACINFHAPVVMRQPGRLQVSWQNDNILKIETDAGKQTRLFYFSTPPVANDASMQGVSIASWQTPAAIRNVTNKLSAQNPVTQTAAISKSGTLQSAAVANGNGTTLGVDGLAVAVVTVNCVSCAGGTTLSFEVTEDGSNFVARDAVKGHQTAALVEDRHFGEFNAMGLAVDVFEANLE